MNILIITGGNSSERKISLLSARNVQKTLEEKGYEVLLFDLNESYEVLKKIALQFDVLFPVLHGEEGEGGTLHKFLSGLGMPIVGTRNYKGMEKGWYKISFKKYCDKSNIETSPWKTVKTKQEIEKFGFPSVLKNSSGGSSREVMILKSIKDLDKAQAKNILKSGQAFIEKYIHGTEITIGVLDNKPLPVIEIRLEKDSWFSYKTKYDGSTKEVPFAPSVDKSLQTKAQRIALKIHKDFNLGSYSRIDFIVSKNKVYALEVNTIPGLTSGSLMPKAAAAAGINFEDFIEILLRKSQ